MSWQDERDEAFTQMQALRAARIGEQYRRKYFDAALEIEALQDQNAALETENARVVAELHDQDARDEKFRRYKASFKANRKQINALQQSLTAALDEIASLRLRKKALDWGKVNLGRDFSAARYEHRLGVAPWLQ